MLNSKLKSKNRYFYHIFVSPGDAPRAITLNVVSIEREFDACLQIISLHVPIYLQQFHSYSNRKCKKIAVFTYSSPHFCFPWRRPCDYHAICCMDGKTIQWLLNSSQHVPICLQYFPSYTMHKSMRKSKNRYFYHIFVSPGDAPGAITLNVVWMEREFPVIQTASANKKLRYRREAARCLVLLSTLVSR